MFTRLLGRTFFPPRARNHYEGVRLRFAPSASIPPKRPTGASQRSSRMVPSLKDIDQAIWRTSRSGLCPSAFLPRERDHLQCSKVPNLILMKTELEEEVGVTLGVRELWKSNGGLPDRLFCMFGYSISNRAPTADFRVGGRPVSHSNFSVALRVSRFDEFLDVGQRSTPSTLRTGG